MTRPWRSIASLNNIGSSQRFLSQFANGSSPWYKFVVKALVMPVVANQLAFMDSIYIRSPAQTRKVGHKFILSTLDSRERAPWMHLILKSAISDLFSPSGVQPLQLKLAHKLQRNKDFKRKTVLPGLIQPQSTVLHLPLKEPWWMKYDVAHHYFPAGAVITRANTFPGRHCCKRCVCFSVSKKWYDKNTSQ